MALVRCAQIKAKQALQHIAVVTVIQGVCFVRVVVWILIKTTLCIASRCVIFIKALCSLLTVHRNGLESSSKEPRYLTLVSGYSLAMKTHRPAQFQNPLG